jgi:hypothetical protein
MKAGDDPGDNQQGDRGQNPLKQECHGLLLLIGLAGRLRLKL